MTMTVEQRKLVEENHNLIYYVFHRYCKGQHLEDVYGDLAIALCYASSKYRNNKNIDFSTYAVTAMLNRLKQLKTNASRLKRTAKVVSYDNSPKGNETTVYIDQLTYLDLLEDKRQNVEEKVILKSVLRDINALPPNKKEIMSLLIQNENMSEVARIVGISRQCMTEKIRKIQKKLMTKYRG